MCQICRPISPKCAHVLRQTHTHTHTHTHRYNIHTIQDLVSELRDITGNPPRHQNLGKTSDASLTRIDSTRQLSSPVVAINLDSHYDNSPMTTTQYCTMTHLDRASEIPFAATSTRHRGLPALSRSSFNFSHSSSSSSSSLYINVLYPLFLFDLHTLNSHFQFLHSCEILLAQKMGFSRKRHQCGIPHKSTSTSEA